MMKFLSTFVAFENLHEVRRLCHWGPIIALSVIAICSTMAMLDSIIWYWPLDTTGGSINFIMLINWTVLILYNYFNAMFVGPGYIPLGWKPVRFFYIYRCLNNIKLYNTLQMFLYSGKSFHSSSVTCCFSFSNRRINMMLSTYNIAEFAKVTRPLDPTTVESVTGKHLHKQTLVMFFFSHL